MSTLKKNIRDLTKQDMADLTKPLGVKGWPYPMLYQTTVENAKGEKTHVKRLGVLEADRKRGKKPLIVYSDRDYEDVMSMATRDMVTPSMLPMFFDALSRRKPNNKFRLQYIKGAAGAGKTFMSELVGRMRSAEGAIKIDCTGLNASELLFETVLDLNNNRTFYEELDKRLQNGKLNPLSLSILKQSLGGAFVEEDGVVSIDWTKVGRNLREKPQDEKSDYVESREAVELALQGLREVSELEGLGTLGGNALGMLTQKGPVIRAHEEGREIILDEFNRLKRNTTGALHGWLQFVIGEMDPCTVRSTIKEKGDDRSHTYTFQRADMKAGFFVTLTGNTEADGSEVSELPQSLSSRIVPKHVPLATEQDWQHRICQMLTGMPVSTLYAASKKQWDANPEAFRTKLMEWRKLREKREIPEIHLRLLRRWEEVDEASVKLAKFYYGWSQIVNPESVVHRSGKLSDVLNEIDDAYSREVTVDFRKITVHINEALEARPPVTALEESEGYDLGPVKAPCETFDDEDGEENDPAATFGTRLADAIINQITADTLDRGKETLYRQLMRHAEDCGIIPPQLHEGRKGNNRTIAILLDDNPYEGKGKDVRAEYVRNLLCTALRERYPEIAANNNELMSVAMVRQSMERLADEAADAAQKNEADKTGIVVFNDDPKTIYNEPLRVADTYDPVLAAPVAPGAAVAPAPAHPSPGELLSRRDLLFSLAAPGLRQRNLRALWNKAITATGSVVKGTQADADESLSLAENSSVSGIAVTTVLVREDDAKGQGVQVPLHIVWNRTADRVLVVGEGSIGARLRTAFVNSRLTYIDRADTHAGRQARQALTHLLDAENERQESLIKNAFLMRNMLDSRKDEKTLSLTEILVRRDIKTFLPHYLMNKRAEPKPKAA